MRTKLFLAAASLGAAVLLIATRPAAPVDAGTALRLSVPELVVRSGLVLEGRVLSERALEGPCGLIETEYTLALDRTFWGQPQPQRVVRLPGGRLDDGRGLVLPGLPRLVVGDDVLVFLSEPGSTGLRVPIGLSQGVHRVVTDANGRRSLLSDHTHLTVANLVTGALQEGGSFSRRDYAAVVAEIHAAVEQRHAGALALPEAAPALPEAK